MTRKEGGWNIVNYTSVIFLHVMVQHAHGAKGQPFAGNYLGRSKNLKNHEKLAKFERVKIS